MSRASSIGSTLRRIRARLQARDDTEHEQALIRIGVAFVMYIYLLAIPLPADDRAFIVRWVTVIFLLDLVAAAAILTHIIRWPAINPKRRLAAIVVDSVAPTSVMLVGGPSASALYPMLLWIILGHGFRYGRPYLWACAGLSVVLFGLVVLVSPAWRAIPAVSGALVASLVILPVYFAILLRKLTNAINRAEEASRAKSRFLAAMSHELRTPLNAIIGMGELLATTRLDAEQRDMTATVRTAATSLLGLVDQVLDLAKIEERRFTIDIEAFDLHDSIARIRMLLGQLAAAKGLSLRLRLAPDTPYRLRGGPRQLHQVLVNLIGNAIKFTDHGRVRLCVSQVQSVGAEVRLRFAVEDTGVGLSPEDQQHLFERFARSDDSIKRGISGSGLGLSITRELVQLMGGTIGMSSAVGVGSTFWFELPLQLDPAPVPVERLSGRVVVIGGRDTAPALAERLLQFGCQARCVATAESAAELLRHVEDRPAVVLTDRSPPVDAAALAERLAGISPLMPIDLIGVGMELPSEAGSTLADLPADVADLALFASLRAAMRQPPSTLGPMVMAVAAADEPPGRSLTVLVAEDNRTNQKVIGRILERAGHRATIVATGQEAVEALEEPGFDLVLMDLNMPELGGIDAVKLLRFTHDIDELPPIIALSADATAQTREACRTVGFSAYLTKPVDTRQLLRTMDELARVPMTGPAPAQPSLSESTADSTFMKEERPILDPSRLASLAELDHGDGFLDSLIDDFVADLDVMLADVARAVSGSNARALRDHAHALRSSAAHIGALALFDVCLGWRDLDDHALIMRAPMEAARLDIEAHRVKAALAAFKESWQVGAAGPVCRK